MTFYTQTLSLCPGCNHNRRVYVAFVFIKTFLHFLQLAQGQDGSFRRFAVLEFATAEMAEEAQRLSDGRLLAGTHIRVSFCAPGPPGRSMLAALIAAQTMVFRVDRAPVTHPRVSSRLAVSFGLDICFVIPSSLKGSEPG